MRDNSAPMNPTTTDAMRSVHLLGFDNGVGLSRNLRLLATTLRARGYRVDFTNTRRRGGLPGLIQRAKGKRHASQLARMRRRGLPPPYDFVLMEEHITAAYLDDAPHRVLLPHPEWFLPRDMEALGHIDLVLAKTREAQRVFAAQGCRAVCIGFTSEDRQDAAVLRERAFFHLAGSSRTKNTEPLLALWRRHPEWPRLTVVQHASEAKPGAPATNIDHRVGYLDDAELKRLGILFPDRRFGEVIFLLEPGCLFAKSDFNGRGWNPIGMHGYHPSDPFSDAIFLSNKDPRRQMTHIADIYPCLEEASSR